MANSPAVLKSRWIAVAGVAVLVLAAGVGWFVFGHQAKAPQTAATAIGTQTKYAERSPYTSGSSR